MFERTVEFRTTNFNDISVTNSLFKRFYNYIHYNIEDNYPESTKMVLKSSSTLDFQIDCHKLYSKKFYVQKNTLPQVFDTSKIYGSFNGGTIKNEKKNVIADWAELPKQYMKVTFYQNLSYSYHLINFTFREMIFLLYL